MKKETKVLCPQCGVEFEIAKKGFTTVATVIGKDSRLGTVYPIVVGQGYPALPNTAQERIEALRHAGLDVSNLFAMQGANGGEYVASNKDGKLSILNDDDPIFSYIIKQGTVPNRRLFRRWVTAQMFHLMSYTPYLTKEPLGVTEMIHRFGYEYQWKMLMNELYAQVKMESRDPENFVDRNRWFNAHVVVEMAKDYVEELKKHVDTLHEKKCKGIPYKHIHGRDIFVSDLYSKLYNPLNQAIERIKQAKNASQLYSATNGFNEKRIRMRHETPQSKVWIDAYKGTGAYFTAQNLIRFQNCLIIDDAGFCMDKYHSLNFLLLKAEKYKNGEGWLLLAFLKKMLDDNHIDIKKKMAEWRKKK